MINHISLMVVLLALDGPVGQGIPPVLARFGGEQIPAIHATFARHPAESLPQVEIEWFLDGGALAVPVGKSVFLCSRTFADHPILTHGTFLLDFPASQKTETYRGLLCAIDGQQKSKTALATIHLAIFPPETFSKDWESLAASDLKITLVGTLPGLRDFLLRQKVPFSEGDLLDPSTIHRDGMLVVDAEDGKNLVLPSAMVRGMLVFAAPDRSWSSGFEVHDNGGAMLWTQRRPGIEFVDDPLAQAQFLSIARPLVNKTQP